MESVMRGKLNKSDQEANIQKAGLLGKYYNSLT